MEVKFVRMVEFIKGVSKVQKTTESQGWRNFQIQSKDIEK